MKAAISSFIGLVFVVCASAEPLIEGRVYLDSGESVADAQVQIFDLADLRQGAIARATTDGTGYFALPLAALGGSARPTSFTLGPNYPNPFNPATIIPYQLVASSEVRLEVFNLLGQRITTLVDGARSAGFHTAQWHATDAAGRAVAAGVYIYRMTVGVERQTGRMVLVDGQAGVPAAGAASAGLGASGGESDGASEPVYGLVVSGEGLVPYVDSAFRAQASRGPVELVVETLDRTPRAKRAGSGILGDVDNNGRVDFFDALVVALYSGDSSIVIPNNGDIALGDVNRDGQVTFYDAYLIAQYLADPLDPSLPSGIGELGEVIGELGEVAIPDANLRAVIADSLGKAPDASITRAEMATLTRIDAPNKGIRSLTGLEHATNVTRLDLGGVWEFTHINSNVISDLSPLSNLTNLRWLDLSDNAISDISPLAGLTNLRNLDLSDNAISDISPLAGLTNLEYYLGLSGNAISDISPLSNLTNLRWLTLFDNAISDISLLSNLTNLRWLELSDNAISDISVLAGLTNLWSLDLSGNNISDISVLLGLTNLTNLLLFDNAISDVSPLAGLTNLTQLGLSDNAISDVSPLAGLTNLTNLLLSDNAISDISPLLGLTNLLNLWLKRNPLNATSLNDHIPALQARGVSVSFDSTPATGDDPPLTTGDACSVGQELSSGQSCTVDIPNVNVGSNRFEVRSDGSGCYGNICAGTSVNLNGFQASKIAGTSRWRIDALPSAAGKASAIGLRGRLDL